MGLSRGVESHPLARVKAGKTEFYTPQDSHETMLVQIPPHTIDDLFVHRFQTDQLMVVKGRFVLVVLHDGVYQYLPMCDRIHQVVTIPPGVPHGAIHLGEEECVVVNALLRHGPPHERDYQPCPRPFPYDLDRAWQTLADLEALQKAAA